MDTPYLRVLSSEEMGRIHDASLHILERTGMLIDHRGARDILRESGAEVDDDTGVVKFPPTLVESGLALLPRQVLHAGREPLDDFVVGTESDVYGRTAGGATQYLDLRTNQYRRATLDDWREFCTLADALPNIRSCGTMHCTGVPEETADLHSLRVLLESQRNNIVHNAFRLQNLRYMIEMMLVVRGGREALRQRPWLHTIISPISPLFLNQDDTAQLLLAGEYGLPTTMPIMPSVGTTGPMTLAGTLALANAEFLGTVTLAEAAFPGHSIPYFLDPVVADMKTGAPLMGAPEVSLICAAIAQLGFEFYRLAPEGIGLDCDSLISGQIMFQKGTNSALQVMAGGKLLVGAGVIETCLAASPAQLVVDDEIIGHARRWYRGIRVDEDSLAVDVVGRVGPRGQFLSDKHTTRAMRAGELLRPAVFDRERHDEWVAHGRRELLDIARERALDILGAHEVTPLPDDVLGELQAITDRADREATSRV
jgi:trimethylamine--corrinoid protein Co-methyltransferase